MGRRWRSPALVADGRHLLSDVATSIGVLIGLGLVQLTGYVVTRAAGRLIFIEFHLVVPAIMTVADAHIICDRLEAALHENVRDCRVTIHVEPEGEARHKGVLVV